MSVIQVKNLSFRYDSSLEDIFKDVTFNIDTDWKLGVIGRNGKGKTTLLKLLLGEYEYQGNILKNIEFRYFPFEVKDKNKITSEIVLEISPNIEEWEVMKELNLLDMAADVLYRPFNTLSGGEQIKVLFAVAFCETSVFLLIDEPTNHLDTETTQVITKYLKSKKGFILVSHDRSIIDETCDHILSINNTNIEIQKGNYSTWKQNKENQDNFELNQNEKLKKDISLLQETTRRTKEWAKDIEKSKYVNKKQTDSASIDKGYIGHQSAKMQSRAKNTENRANKAIEEKSKLLKNIDKVENLIIHPLEYAKDSLIYAKNISINYSKNILFEGLSFEINKGDRAAITGKNGSGKSSILKLLLGEEIEYTGELTIGNNIKISYISQDTSYLSGNLKQYANSNNIDDTMFRTNLIHLGFSKSDFDKEIQNLSEGQKKKILIAKSLTEEANLYIWDEPLNYVDILSKEQIEEAILQYKPTIIFVDHDKTFTNNIANKVIEL